MEQKEAGGKDEDAPIPEESRATGPRGTRGVVIGSAARPAKMNIGGANPDERQEHRNTQRGSREKDISGGKVITDDTHDPGRSKAACRGEALIAAEPFTERRVSDHPQADGGNAEPENAPRRPLQEARGEDQ